MEKNKIREKLLEEKTKFMNKIIEQNRKNRLLIAIIIHDDKVGHVDFNNAHTCLYPQERDYVKLHLKEKCNSGDKVCMEVGIETDEGDNDNRRWRIRGQAGDIICFRQPYEEAIKAFERKDAELKEQLKE